MVLKSLFDVFLIMEPVFVGNPIIGLVHGHGEDGDHTSDGPQMDYESLQYPMQQLIDIWI